MTCTEVPSQGKRYNTAKLKNKRMQKEFMVTLSNKFLLKLLEIDTTEQKWHKMKETVNSTHHDVLGPVSYNRKSWVSTETLKKVEERRQKKANVNNKSKSKRVQNNNKERQAKLKSRHAELSKDTGNKSRRSSATEAESRTKERQL
ncbi:hypothetical protein DPMN_089150 [Dreissena polymorpha]|uniref:Uncharacterized protein n=1 Tax=Dreissena polymorpha TaxID=45954 RepID=A0A9D4KWD9_DREPO|nr:hypothetical protein DPMN_089150 [Dreissena polymorpha]